MAGSSARGHRRGQPDLRLGSPRGRRDHHGGLVAQPAYTRPRRGGRRRAARGARAVRPRLRQHPGRPLGVDRRPRFPVVLQSAPRGRHARVPGRLRRHRRPGLPGEGGRRAGPRARPARHHPRRGVGRHRRRRHPAYARERVHDRRPSTCTRLPSPATPTSASRHRRLRLGLDRIRAERRAGLPPTSQVRRHGIPVSLSMDTSVWSSGDLFSAMRPPSARTRPASTSRRT